MTIPPLKIFIATQPLQERATNVLEYSIEMNTGADVEIIRLCAGEGLVPWVSSGPTGFTLFRFCVPELCGFEGTAICLDPDMLVLGDVAELHELARPGKWVQHPHTEGDCVSVIDCAAVKRITGWPSIEAMKTGVLRKWNLRPKLDPIRSRTVPGIWNSMDSYVPGETKLIHYTKLATQPWHPNPAEKYEPHQDPAAVALWEDWERQYHEYN